MKRVILLILFVFLLFPLKTLTLAKESDLIRITVPESGHIISAYTINGESDNVTTYSAHNRAVFSLVGKGNVTLSDQFGNVYFNIFKDSVTLEEFVVDFKLLGGVGTYVLTVRISEEGKGTASKTISLLYKPFPIVPTKGEEVKEEINPLAIIGDQTYVCKNCYLYFFGFAFAWADIIWWILIILLLILLLSYGYYRFDNRRARNNGF